MPIYESLISPTANPALEQGLRERLNRHAAIAGGFGSLEALALRLGLIQGTLTPRFRDPVVNLFAADHGLAIDGVGAHWPLHTAARAMLALQSRLPCAAMARLHGLQLQVIDCGVGEHLAPHPKLLVRKVAHGTRNARLGAAMTVEQMQGCLRIGMELADSHAGNMMVFAALGQGASEVGALLLARLDARRLDEVLPRHAQPVEHEVLQLALTRHRDALEALDVLAALGGLDIAVMAGAMLVAASKRQLLVIDGMAACAALRVAASIAPPVTDYAVFCRSNNDPGIDVALKGFQTSALLELGLESADGLGACIAWPLLRSAAALLSEMHELTEGAPAPVTAEPARGEA